MPTLRNTGASAGTAKRRTRVEHAHGGRGQRDEEQERQHDARQLDGQLELARLVGEARREQAAPASGVKNQPTTRSAGQRQRERVQRPGAPSAQARSRALAADRPSVNVGTNAADSAPSANRSRSRLGTRNATLNASVAHPGAEQRGHHLLAHQPEDARRHGRASDDLARRARRRALTRLRRFRLACAVMTPWQAAILRRDPGPDRVPSHLVVARIWPSSHWLRAGAIRRTTCRSTSRSTCGTLSRCSPTSAATGSTSSAARSPPSPTRRVTPELKRVGILVLATLPAVVVGLLGPRSLRRACTTGRRSWPRRSPASACCCSRSTAGRPGTGTEPGVGARPAHRRRAGDRAGPGRLALRHHDGRRPRPRPHARRRGALLVPALDAGDPRRGGPATRRTSPAATRSCSAPGSSRPPISGYLAIGFLLRHLNRAGLPRPTRSTGSSSRRSCSSLWFTRLPSRRDPFAGSDDRAGRAGTGARGAARDLTAGTDSSSAAAASAFDQALDVAQQEHRRAARRAARRSPRPSPRASRRRPARPRASGPSRRSSRGAAVSSSPAVTGASSDTTSGRRLRRRISAALVAMRIDPGREGGGAREARQRPPGREERLLQRILGLVVADDAAHQAEDRAPRSAARARRTRRRRRPARGLTRDASSSPPVPVIDPPRAGSRVGASLRHASRAVKPRRRRGAKTRTPSTHVAATRAAARRSAGERTTDRRPTPRSRRGSPARRRRGDSSTRAAQAPPRVEAANAWSSVSARAGVAPRACAAGSPPRDRGRAGRRADRAARSARPSRTPAPRPRRAVGARRSRPARRARPSARAPAGDRRRSATAASRRSTPSAAKRGTSSSADQLRVLDARPQARPLAPRASAANASSAARTAASPMACRASDQPRRARRRRARRARRHRAWRSRCPSRRRPGASRCAVAGPACRRGSP